jgi:glutamate synthase (ferredoxin)
MICTPSTNELVSLLSLFLLLGTIGTVACAAADVIQISVGDGGTGASPLSSIKHAGCPWELGPTEAHSALLNNKLRDRVTLRVDGGARTGRNVAIAAMLGAEEFGFGTVAMIDEGCVMARVCHLNTCCPVGVTNQKEELRKKFPGTPEDVVNFFEFVSEEVR